MILGVCEWLSTKTQFSAKNIRILFVLLVLFAGLGIGAYFILWLVKILSKE
ncbi:MULTISPECIES: PspC domain-containing protein [Polaribacter]|uniref:PspC domain-containing protein n=1 Tax=Polaribacter marinaquae TaxID=1642819 RepID=A0ABZ2TNN6_9FLAO|nr:MULTISPECIES: PspC domain-containing protein [unclassified Polaribacter]SHM92613.1 phage shock protein C (PspC) family protein [Polaribacter sp. KT 15]